MSTEFFTGMPGPAAIVKLNALWDLASTPASNSLVGLTDVNITTPLNGQSLTWNSTTGKWVNTTVSGGGGGTTTNSQTIRFNSGTTEGTDQYIFNGSVAKTINFIPGTNVSFSYSSGSVTINADGAQPLDADLTAIAGLVGTSGFLKKTGTNTWALDTNTYITGNQTITVTGAATGSGTTSINLTQTLVPVNKGGTNLTTIPAKSILVANTLDTLTTVTPGNGQSIRMNAGGTAWEAFTPAAGGTGDVLGPASSNTNEIALFADSTGKVIKTSGVTLASKANSGANSDITSLTGITGGISTADYLQLDTAGSTSAVGRLNWNSGESTVEVGLNADVTLQVGQESVVLCYNGTGSSIPNGSVVHITGAQGQRPTIALADADIEASSSKTLGISTQTIANGAEGFVTTQGIVRGLNTSGFTQGTSLWLSSTAGTLTSTKPVPPAHSVFVGYCVNSHASAGTVFVNVQNGYELDELHDVKITSLANKDVLRYNSTSQLWENIPDSTYATSGHTHAYEPTITAGTTAQYWRGDKTWQTLPTGGDASTNTTTSVVNEIAVFSDTGGKTLKRATESGIVKLTSGVLSTATAGTDFAKPDTASSWTAEQTFKEVKDTVFTITDSAGFSIDPANGSVQIVTIAAARTPVATNFEAGQTVLLGISGNFAITWTSVNPTWVKAGGTAAAPSAAASGYLWVLLWKVGTTMYAAEVGKV